MGLDNGIYIKEKSSLPKEDARWETVKKLIDLMEDKEWDVCYWRKCYSIRGDILEVLNRPEEFDEDGDFGYDLDVCDMEAILGILVKANNYEYWEKEQPITIWDYDEFYNFNSKNIRNLILAIAIKIIAPEITFKFYDSY